MNIFIEKGTEYESIGPVRIFFNWLCINPFLNNLHKIGGDRFLKKSSRKAAEVHDSVTTFRALEVMYGFDHWVHFDHGFVDGIFTFLWQHVLNAKAVRNRLRLVKKELQNVIKEVEIPQRGDVIILSIGAGSARAVIEAVSGFVKGGARHIKIIAVDKNPQAGQYAIQLAKDFSLQDFFSSATASLSDEREFLHTPPTIVEMVGLLDYFSDEQAVRALARIYHFLQPGGMLITCNISHNTEETFVTQTMRWPMVYRTPEQLAALCAEAGFQRAHSRFILEPLKIHTVAVLRKEEV